MPARKQVKNYSTKDICEILSISRTRALEMMRFRRSKNNTRT